MKCWFPSTITENAQKSTYICINTLRLCLLVIAIMEVGKWALTYILTVKSIMMYSIIIIILQ